MEKSEEVAVGDHFRSRHFWHHSFNAPPSPGLGALFLMAKSKIHPLWYSEFIPILFFVSSIFAGLCMVIMEGTISHRVLKDHIDPDHHASHDEIIIGLAKFASVAIFVYYFFKLLTFLHNKQWTMLDDFWGFWYILEVVGFVLIPGCYVGLWCKKQKHQHHSGRFDFGDCRNHSQQAQYLHHRLQVGRAREILSFLAGNCGDADDHLHRNLGLQMGRLTDACDEKSTGSIEEIKWKLIIMSIFLKPRDWNICL